MNSKIYRRIIIESRLLLKQDLTIREVAKIMKVSKSTVHKDLHNRLKDIDKNLFKGVDSVLKSHIDVRHINGGKATKLKYQKLRKG